MKFYGSKRAVGGAIARNAGRAFEKLIKSHHDVAVLEGLLAFVFHVDPPVIPAKDRAIFLGPSGADFSGVVWNGLAFTAETKSTKDPHFQRSRISKLQLAHLDATARAGGVAVLVIEFRQEREALWTYRRYAIPWRMVPWRIARTEARISPADLGAWEILGSCYLRTLIHRKPAG